jgi:hypothetical protein
VAKSKQPTITAKNRGKRKTRAEDPRLREKALLIYSLVRFDGLPYAKAWRMANPHSKAKVSSASQMGKDYYLWAEENLTKDVEAMLESQGIDVSKVARKIAELMEANQFRTILEVDKKGRNHQKMLELPDRRIQLEATKTAAEMLGIRGTKMKEDNATNQTMIVFNVGTALEKPEGSGE